MKVKQLTVSVFEKRSLYILTVELKFANVFLLFRYYLPLEKGVTLPLNKLEFLTP